jgi:hypothetical protein
LEIPKARVGRTKETIIAGSRLWKIQMLAGILLDFEKVKEKMYHRSLQ